MLPESKNRILCVLKYLCEYTDEQHPATLYDIIGYLNSVGVNIGTTAGRRTVAADIEQLQECGYDVVCNKGKQNQYFIGERDLELPELKMLVDAVQAAKFITPKKSEALIRKLSGMTSSHQAKELNHRLYIDGRAKTTNENVYYIVDLLYTAINSQKQVAFKYYEYNAQKKRVFKHNGQVYRLSPYDLVWSNDSYYVFGFSENHSKVVKFRVDRMVKPELTESPGVPKPDDYNISEFCRKVFMMYDAQVCTVELLCENSMMKTIIDRFGDKVDTTVMDCTHFKATVEVSCGPTFYAWIFTYAGKIRIVSPSNIVEEYTGRLKAALDNA